ncbi:hypothetical protein GCM10023322_11310 [Rugosimonospora acidiphila]|uniref:Uncharacterized protein n=1 Tax=Rugosimonospora acidiphila TaxID=556531 RepID=A0ABP9RMT4_9ACTN
MYLVTHGLRSGLHPSASSRHAGGLPWLGYPEGTALCTGRVTAAASTSIPPSAAGPAR